MLGSVGRKNPLRNLNLSKKWQGMAIRQREKDKEEMTNLRSMWEVDLADYGAWCSEWYKILGWLEIYDLSR